ncbi:MAG: aminotransferase class V-fold PLP-dependent enzyme [Holosporaceae bacterium]|jgi:cysteine desulfurase|nr:aminotransferase class V-fold PLP-dependent enzyme [Holosporaceae bacterium]
MRGLPITLLLLLASCAGESERVKDASIAADSVYLDYAASFRINSAALSEFARVSRMDGNSSGVNPHAAKLKKLESDAARIVAEKIGAREGQILFTNSASVANNIIILGVAGKNPGCHFVTSKIEHKSVLNVFAHLEKTGYTVTYLDVDRYGRINLDQLERSIRENTRLISVQMLNSEIGVLQNLQAIGKIARRRHVLFHSDAAQSFCRYPIDVDDMNIDFLTMSGHKIGAPKGIAATYIRDRDELQPILFGSGDDLFPGTKPTALVAAFGVAVVDFHLNRPKIELNFDTLAAELLKMGGVHINSVSPSHIISVSIEGVLLQDVLDRLPKYSFAAGCSCIGAGQSNVILAIDPEGKLPSCTLRISFSGEVEPDELTSFAKDLKTVVKQLRREKDLGIGCSGNDDQQKILLQRFESIQKILSKK